MSNYSILKDFGPSAKNEQFLKSLEGILESQKVPKNLTEMTLRASEEVIRKSSGRERPKMEEMFRSKILGNPQILTMFVQIYYYDYLMFDFDFPKLVLRV